MTPADPEICPHCGAHYSPDESFCWMCHRRLEEPGAKVARPQVGPRLSPSTAEQQGASDLDLSESILIFVIIAMFIGALALHTLGFPGFVLLAPALLVLVVKESQNQGQPRNLVEWIRKVLGILATGIAILILGVIALYFAFAATCFFILGVLKLPH